MCALAALAMSSPPAVPELPPIPFVFHLDADDRSAFESSGTKGSRPGVAVTLRTDRVEGGRLDLFQERADAGGGPRWAWKQSATRGAESTLLAGTPAVASILLRRRAGRTGYEISRVFQWPSSERELAVPLVAARTLSGLEPGLEKGGRFRHIVASSDEDAVCELDLRGRWQCIRVGFPGAGVLAYCTPPSSARFTEIFPGSPGEPRLQTDGWVSALLLETSEATSSSVEPSFTLVSPRGGGGLTQTRAPLSGHPLGGQLYWTHGPVVLASHLLVRRGAETARIQIDTLKDNGCGEPLRVALAPGHRVGGSVTDGSGRVLVGASVLALEEGAQQKSVLVASTKTDDLGSYGFSELEQHVSRLRACHASAGCSEKELLPGNDTLNFSLSPRWVFRGRTVSQSGVPLSKSHLRLVPLLESYEKATDRLLLIPPESDALSDDSGKFEISVPAPGEYHLEARAAGSGTARRRVGVTSLTSARTELGDLVLSGSGEFLAKLSGARCSGGFLTLIGPIDVGTPATIREFPVEADAARVELPEGGTWLVQARCPDGLRSVAPEALTSVEEFYGQQIPLAVGERIDPPRPESKQ